MKKFLLIVILNLFFTANVLASEQIINLVVGYKTVYFAGKSRQAIAVNNQIPAPILHFKEGDHVTINVYNRLNEETAVHWHGVLVPWQMDGVLGVNQHGIQPGKVFRYQFIVPQSGTYWYHAHAGLQEQEGFYGAFLIDPPKAPPYHYTKDYVVVLSDWSNTNGEQIFKNLKKDGDYYSPRFPLQPSLSKFIHDYRKATPEEQKKLIDDYKMMQQMRMSIYDINDVAYDAFLLNGRPKCNPWTSPVKLGDVVRLRFIGAGGSTIFRVKIPGTPMQMVHVQGNDIKPYTINDFAIAPGETYDVLVKIQKTTPYIIYAESADTVGAAYGALITSPNQFVNYQQITPFPEPLPVTREMMSNMMMSGMDHGSMNMGGSSAEIKNQMTMPSHSKAMSSSSPPHDMKLMPTKKAKSKPNHSAHSPPSMESKSSSTPMKHSADMSGIDHGSMDMNKMPKEDKTSTSTMKHSLDEKNPNSSSMQMTNHSAPSAQSESFAAPMAPNMDMSGMDHGSINNKTPKENKISSPTMEHSTDKKNSSSSTMQMNHTALNKMDQSMAHKPMKMKTSNHKAKPLMMDHGSMKMKDGMSMNHSMNMPTEPTIIGDTITPPSSLHPTMKMDTDMSMAHTMAMGKQGMASKSTTPGTKYQNLVADVKTNDPNKPVDGTINMELFGYMDRFIWFINGLPEYKAHPIVLEPGKRYRLIFTNNSMMHHPMHIHGHWFILRKGLGSYDPLLHTIDVAPGATMIADIDTDASGQWFFHCHMLYHMMAGMSRVIQYSTIIEITKGERLPQNIVKQTAYVNRPIVRVDEVRPIDPSLVKHPQGHHAGLYLATFLDVGADPFNNVQRITYKGLYGPDYDKLELFTNDAEISKGTVENADIDIFYWRLMSQFWAVKGGVNYFYRPAQKPYWQPGLGIEGLMPYFIDTNVRAYLYAGSAKLDVELSRDTQITNNFFIRLGIRSILASKTVNRAAIGSGLNQMRYIIRPYYRLMPGVNLIAEFEREQDYGSFKRIQSRKGEATSENTLTFGISFLF